jgi:hypothetical protein
LWESLRRAFDLLVPYVDAPGKHEVAEPMQRIVFATPGLRHRPRHESRRPARLSRIPPPHSPAATRWMRLRRVRRVTAS